MNEIRGCLLGCRNPDGYARRAAPGLLVCPPCSEKLRGVLTALERTFAAVTELDELIPGGRGGGVRTVPGPRSPAVDGILAHTDPRSSDDNAALATVEAWARWVRAERSIDVEPGQMLATVPAGRITMARELATLRFNWEWLMGSVLVPEFAEAMRAVLQALRQVRGELDRVTRVGRCPIVVAVIELPVGGPVKLACGASLRVRPGATDITCRNCGESWARDRWSELGDARADYATFSAQFGVPNGTLRRWAKEDGWDRTGTRGRSLWLRAEVFASYVRRRGDLSFEEAG